ncbi:PadR family transcriptional regulator [Actinocorallia sp. B10E7]|uniref:PadR family transcriptional regulator n=1 Tax=Actinocorallia sp. B10E7 TaxID=3153558 RepID=UPI00325DC7CC
MARWDLVGTTVMALLTQKPRHPYELHRFILDTRKDYVSGLPRSLYHAVDRLARDGLIEVAEVEREGRGPERTVYRITREGREELAHRLRHMLERPDPDTTVIHAALSLSGVLPSTEIARCLRVRAAALEGLVTTADATLQGLDLPRMLLLEVEYSREVNAAELSWIHRLLTELASGELAWAGLLEKEE